MKWLKLEANKWVYEGKLRTGTEWINISHIRSVHAGLDDGYMADTEYPVGLSVNGWRSPVYVEEDVLEKLGIEDREQQV